MLVLPDEGKGGNWAFAYIGANQDAWANGAAIGIHASNTSDYEGTLRPTTTAMRKVSGTSLRSDSLFVSKDADPTLHLATGTRPTACN